MTLTDSVISLNGQLIIGKDSKKYVIEIPGEYILGIVYIDTGLSVSTINNLNNFTLTNKYVN